MTKEFDLIVVGSGAAGMMAAIEAAKKGHRVLLLEKLGQIGAKLKATGGGRCNLTNTLSNESFMQRFGRNGRFMTPALELFDHKALIAFFQSIGVQTHAPDGYRVFPVTHNSQTILTALQAELERQHVTLLCHTRVDEILLQSNHVTGVRSGDKIFTAPRCIIATGGLGYPTLGAEGDGHQMAQHLGHKITPLHPAMMPLQTQESWIANCRADTIPKVELRVDLPKAKKLRATGDLIFTKNGIRGPVVLDFAREVTPLLEKHGKVPLLLNLTKGMHEDALHQHFKKELNEKPGQSLLALVTTLLPQPLAKELCHLAQADPDTPYTKLDGPTREKLIKLLAWTPLTVTGHDGFKMAMITRGGISLKEIIPETMQSRLVGGLYFCGEVMDLDGPCGGYNLQWSFASGYLAGQLL